MQKSNINPWLQLWTQPRATFRNILETDRKWMVVWLALIRGITGVCAVLAMIWLQPWTTPRDVPHTFIMAAMLIIVGAISGIVNLYFSGWLFKLTGGWIGGKGKFIDLKCAIGWSNYPLIIYDLIVIIGAFVTYDTWSPNSSIFLWVKGAFTLISLAILIWSLIITLKLIGEAHQFSAWKGLVTVLLGAVLIFVVVVAIALFVPLLAPIFQ